MGLREGHGALKTLAWFLHNPSWKAFDNTRALEILMWQGWWAKHQEVIPGFPHGLQKPN